jgi:hypothetical protein
MRRLLWGTDQIASRHWRFIVEAWLIWCQCCGLLSIAFGAGFGLVQCFATNGPVSVMSNQKVLTPNPVVGQSLVYEVTVDRRESCPGQIIDLWQRDSDFNRVQTIVTRPIVSTAIKVTPSLRIAVVLPREITAGPWHYKSVLESTCPTRKHEDLIIETDVTVVPS